VQRFRFSLEKVRQWRHTQVELEEAQLEKLFAERLRLKSALAQLGAGRAGEEQAILRLASVEAQQLSSLDRYQRHVEERKQQIHGQARDCDRRIAEQRARLLDARRNFQLLDKLKERRLVEWRLDFTREQEAHTAEAYLARWKADS
jgi:flagellar export protein FliJ